MIGQWSMVLIMLLLATMHKLVKKMVSRHYLLQKIYTKTKPIFCIDYNKNNSNIFFFRLVISQKRKYAPKRNYAAFQLQTKKIPWEFVLSVTLMCTNF